MIMDVHKYRDGWTVLWRFAMPGEKVCGKPLCGPRDIGRHFRDPVDFGNFILGDKSERFVLEAQDL